MLRSPSNLLNDLIRRIEALEKAIRSSQNQQVVTLPTYDHTALPHDMQNQQIFIDSVTHKLYIYITGTGAILIGP